MAKEWNVVGLMSGTSLDGIDIAWCRFIEDGKKWSYNIEKAATVPYPYVMRKRLENATQLTAYEYAKLNNDLGEHFAEAVNGWLGEEKRPDFIASHGHTVFHQPEIGLTTQIGSGAVIAAKTKLPVVCDFRSLDVALDGQGAPLVPIGDELLFSEYDACLNLGGFSNISYHSDNQRIAFDISPCNMALNHLAETIGLDFDTDGEIASKGETITTMLYQLNNLPYYKEKAPKSLGKEWFLRSFMPIIREFHNEYSTKDLLRTVTEHISDQVTKCIPERCNTLLVTGGGAKNKFLTDKIKAKRPDLAIAIPNDIIIDYKEALIFAFLGILRIKNRVNTLKSVTGAGADSCGGCIYLA